MFKVASLGIIIQILLFTAPALISADNNERKLILSNILDKKNIIQYSEILEDNNNLSFNEITNDNANNIKWIKTKADSFSFGFTDSTYWICFSAVNLTEKAIKWSIEIVYPHIDSIELYQVVGNNYKSRKAGDSLPFKRRDINYRNCVFNIEQEPGSDVIYYMKFKTSSSMSLSLYAWSPNLLADQINRESIIFGLYYGVITIFILFSLFSFFSMKEKIYLFYSLWVAGYGLYQISVNGLSYQFLWPSSPGWQNYSIPFFVFFGSIWCLQLGRELLKTKLYLRVFDVIIRFFLGLSIAGSVLTFILPYSVIIQSSAIYAMFVVLIMQITGISALYKRISFSGYYILSWTAIFLGGFVFALKSLGFLPDNFITNYGQQLGSVLQILLVALGYAVYINTINKDNLEAQKDTINALRTAAMQNDEHLEQAEESNIEIGKLNKELNRNIKDLSEANKRISLSEEKYRILVEGTNDIVFSLDENCNFITINKALIKHLNIKPEKMISKHFLDIIYDDTAENVSKKIIQEKLDQLKKEKKTVSFKSDFKSSLVSESKEMTVVLEYVDVEGGFEIIGKAIRVEDDALMKHVDFEKQRLTIGNYFITAEEISYRITRNLAKYINQKDVHLLRIAVREIIINAIEHGNLNISFEEKSRLMEESRYFEFLSSRQKDPDYSGRDIKIEYSIDSEKAVYKITDFGEGFDHKSVISAGVTKVNQELISHGRGIKIVKNAFDEVRYNKKGNQVLLIKYFK